MKLPPKKKMAAAPPKKASDPAKPKIPAKIVVTTELRRIWWSVRKPYNISLVAFSNSLSALNDLQANMLYDVVKVGLFKDSYAQILREQPSLRALVFSDEDRIFMHDVYMNLSWRLDRSEPFPKDVELKMKLKGSIARNASFVDYS